MGRVWRWKEERRRMREREIFKARWKPDGITDNREEMMPHIRRAKELRLMQEMWVYLPENCNAKTIQL